MALAELLKASIPILNLGSRSHLALAAGQEQIFGEVFERDNHTCRECGIRIPGMMEIDHLDGHRRSPAASLATICQFCHNLKHPIWASARKRLIPIHAPDLSQQDIHRLAWTLVAYRNQPDAMIDAAQISDDARQRHDRLARAFRCQVEQSDDDIGQPESFLSAEALCEAIFSFHDHVGEARALAVLERLDGIVRFWPSDLSWEREDVPTAGLLSHFDLGGFSLISEEFEAAANLATAISPNAAGGDKAVLPRIAIVDIGPSSAGLISLLQESLPAERRNEVVFQKLKMDRDYAINVFDTQLGMRMPMSGEMTFLINFLNLICSDGDVPPTAAMRGLIAATIETAYEQLSDNKNPRRYIRGDVGPVDRALEELGFDETTETIWWEVVDVLMEAGKLVEAEIAQRQAVPLISDLVTASQTEQITALYGSASDSDTGQSILTSFQRMISEVVRDYPILSSYTRYSIGSARIVSMDLMDVTARGTGSSARKQTAIMYMLARQVMTRDFFLSEEDIRLMARRGYLPEIFLAHHVARARHNLQVPKIICMDEFHRTGNIEGITSQVFQDAREGRKFNIDIKIASQLIEDFPKALVEIASSIIVCNTGSENSIDYLDKLYTLTQNDRLIMRHKLRGPSADGAPIWALFKTKTHGEVRQELLLTLGPVELWAFSTTAEDVAVQRTELIAQCRR